MHEDPVKNSKEISELKMFVRNLELVLPGEISMHDNKEILIEFVKMFPESSIILKDILTKESFDKLLHTDVIFTDFNEFKHKKNVSEEMKALSGKLLTRAGLVSATFKIMSEFSMAFKIILDNSYVV